MELHTNARTMNFIGSILCLCTFRWFVFRDILIKKHFFSVQNRYKQRKSIVHTVKSDAYLFSILQNYMILLMT